jgi:Ran-binding protein 3
MRAAGHLRLLLNAALYPGMLISTMDGGKGVSFACVNAAEEGAGGAAAADGANGSAGDAAPPSRQLRTFAVRLKGGDAEERTLAFKAAVEAQLPSPRKTPGKSGDAEADAAPAAQTGDAAADAV